MVGGYPEAVSIGIALINPIVDQLPNRSDIRLRPQNTSIMLMTKAKYAYIIDI
jgi:hypothetical protein